MVVFLLMGYGHTVARFFNWTRVEHVLGIGFIIVKVALLLALEVAIFPTLSGWWIDICSLKLCDSTLADRINYLYTAPGTTTFLHWLVMTLSNVFPWPGVNISFHFFIFALITLSFTFTIIEFSSGRDGICVLFRFFCSSPPTSHEAWSSLVSQESE